MVSCPICDADTIEKGMLFKGKWVCSECVEQIAQAHCRKVNEEEEDGRD